MHAPETTKKSRTDLRGMYLRTKGAVASLTGFTAGFNPARQSMWILVVGGAAVLERPDGGMAALGE